MKGKVVVITGAVGGIGKALCHRFGRAGARLGLADIDGEGVDLLCRELETEGLECLGLPLNVADEEACRKAMTDVADHFGCIDVLINNAGITHRSAFCDTETKVYRRVMDVNYFGSINCTKAALDELVRSRGLIVVTSSVAGFAPLLGRTGYAASKHALHGLFGSLRSELKSSGVAVTIVCPGFTATDIDKHALDADGRPTKHPQSTVGKAASPVIVADEIFRAAVKRKRLLVLSGVGRLSRLMTRFCPALYERIMERSLRAELER
jgi:NAD(P)-dependent dehydrogenase (short-subunit alcohol dehydrogenase family)